MSGCAPLMGRDQPLKFTITQLIYKTTARVIILVDYFKNTMEINEIAALIRPDHPGVFQRPARCLPGVSNGSPEACQISSRGASEPPRAAQSGPEPPRRSQSRGSQRCPSSSPEPELARAWQSPLEFPRTAQSVSEALQGRSGCQGPLENKTFTVRVLCWDNMF